ncbi:hypothetical protein GCM10023188_27580 [Pontibacter saemangeumensis]|uniref:Uncharacterized protein n=1 Tax=Pontibacter saemangeumensis TaxID=1084525 RepID=A0ABP8LS96_9BACT
MNDHESIKSVLQDWKIIQGSKLERLGNDYDSERRKRRISKNAAYSVCFSLTMKSGNSWFIFMSKAPSLSRYKDIRSVNLMAVAYYHAPDGLRAVKLNLSGLMTVFTWQVFSSYNEKAGLNLTEPEDIVEDFFHTNGYFESRLTDNAGSTSTLSICRSGMLPGEMQPDGWIMAKDFISRDEASQEQKETEEEILKTLQKDIEDELNKPDTDRDHYNFLTDLMKGISPDKRRD